MRSPVPGCCSWRRSRWLLPGQSFSTPASCLCFSGWRSRPTIGDGRVARIRGTASASGQLFDHGTDFLFVTTALAGAALAGLVTPILPVLIAVAFTQYVLDSYLLYRQKRLRMSAIGRWNGIFYFVPLVVIATSRLGLFGDAASLLTQTASGLGYALAVSTVVSVIDRALAPVRDKTL